MYTRANVYTHREADRQTGKGKCIQSYKNHMSIHVYIFIGIYIYIKHTHIYSAELSRSLEVVDPRRNTQKPVGN